MNSSDSVVSADLDSAILLHGIMSSGAEADFELSYRVNVDATRALLLNLAKSCPGVRVLYASSEAVYGTPVPKTGVTERDITTPEMSYGCQKIICETLINDLTRRGMINGFSLRFPTISVRPGAPSAAISSFLSRHHPRATERAGVRGAAEGPRVAPLDVVSQYAGAQHPGGANTEPRLPATAPEDGQHARICGYCAGYAGCARRDRWQGQVAICQEEENLAIRSTLYSWADDFDNSLALSLGMKQDKSFVQSVKDYVETLEPDRE